MHLVFHAPVSNKPHYKWLYVAILEAHSNFVNIKSHWISHLSLYQKRVSSTLHCLPFQTQSVTKCCQVCHLCPVFSDLQSHANPGPHTRITAGIPWTSPFQLILPAAAGEALLWGPLFGITIPGLKLLPHSHDSSLGPCPLPNSPPHSDYPFPLATERLLLSLKTKPWISLQPSPGRVFRSYFRSQCHLLMSRHQQSHQQSAKI